MKQNDKEYIPTQRSDYIDALQDQGMLPDITGISTLNSNTLQIGKKKPLILQVESTQMLETVNQIQGS